MQLERLHHLSNETIGQDDSGIAIFVREFEGQDREIGHLLYRGGGECKIAIVAVASALNHGKVIALLGSDVSQPRAAPHHVNNHAGEFGARQVGDALLHQAQTGAGGSRHDANAGRSGAVDHVDGSGLALRLNESAADFGQVKGSGFGDFAGRSDGISVVRPASGEHCAFDHRNVAFTELAHVRLPVLRQQLWAAGAAGIRSERPAPGSNRSRCRSRCTPGR